MTVLMSRAVPLTRSVSVTISTSVGLLKTCRMASMVYLLTRPSRNQPGTSYHKGTKTPSFYFLCLCVLEVQYGLPPRCGPVHRAPRCGGAEQGGGRRARPTPLILDADERGFTLILMLLSRNTCVVRANVVSHCEERSGCEARSKAISRLRHESDCFPFAAAQGCGFCARNGRHEVWLRPKAALCLSGENLR